VAAAQQRGAENTDRGERNKSVPNTPFLEVFSVPAGAGEIFVVVSNRTCSAFAVKDDGELVRLERAVAAKETSHDAMLSRELLERAFRQPVEGSR
jgi:hypothetical protein